MTTSVTASIELALTVAVRGYYQPGERMTRDDPGCDACVEDVEIEGLTTDVRYACRSREDNRPQWAYRTIDLLQGVDRTSAAYRQIEANIIAAMGAGTIEQELFENYQRHAA